MRIVLQIGARLLRLIAVFLVVTFAVAAVSDLMPGDPAVMLAGENARPETVAAINAQYGFNDSVFVRYGRWLKDLVHGDLGISYFSRQPVAEAIRERLPVTLELATLSIVLAVLVAIPLAIAAARRPDSVFDRGLAVLTSVKLALPTFVVALLLSYLFVFRFELLPGIGWTPLTKSPVENLRHAALPVLSIALGEIVLIFRVLRADLIETLQQDFISLARSKGLSGSAVMWKHALRPASISTVTLVALQLASLLGGSIIVESIFVLPGLGAYLIKAVNNKDIVAIQGTVAFIAIVILAVNFIVDVTYTIIDPRVRGKA